MRLSPKSIFFGLVALGLPISIVAGWALATPARRPASIGVPGGAGGMGAGGIGSAPERTTRQPDVPVHYSSQPPRPGISLPPGTVVPAPVTSTEVPSVSITSAPSATPSGPDLPPLTDPPMPTPTEVVEPPPPSATPPGDWFPDGPSTTP